MKKIEKKRGALLTIWLVIMLIVNFSWAVYSLLFNSTIASFYPNVPSWIFYIYGLVSLANFILVIFLFMWKKWPLFIFCGISIIVFIINLMIGLGILGSIFGLAGPIILYLLMKSKWDLFK